LLDRIEYSCSIPQLIARLVFLILTIISALLSGPESSSPSILNSSDTNTVSHPSLGDARNQDLHPHFLFRTCPESSLGGVMKLGKARPDHWKMLLPDICWTDSKLRELPWAVPASIMGAGCLLTWNLL
jgi:hypothetical protein